MVLSSEFEITRSSLEWKIEEDTFEVWPKKESCSQALVSVYFQSFNFLSSAEEIIRFWVGWKWHQFTPRS